MLLCGIDIGGTKCALSLGNADENGNIEITFKEKFDTMTPDETLGQFSRILEKQIVRTLRRMYPCSRNRDV